MNSLRRCTLLSALLVSSLFPAVAARADILVDSFTEAQPLTFPYSVISNNSIGSGKVETSLASVAGGVRGTFLSNVSSAFPGFGSVTLDLFDSPTFSVLDFSQTASTAGILTLSYGTMTIGSPLAWTFNPATDSVQLLLASYDQPAGTQLSVMTTLKSGATTFVLPTLTTVNAPGAQLVTIPLISLAGVTTIDGLQLDISAPSGSDFDVDAVHLTNVPEPASLGLMMLGGAALLRRRRR